MEGPLDTADFPALRVLPQQLRGHLCTLVTLGIESVAKTTPEVSFIHDYPGSVNTGLYRDMEGPPFDPKLGVPIGECGERHLYLATSMRYKPRDGDASGVELGVGINTAMGTTGRLGQVSIPSGQMGRAHRLR